MPIFFLYGLNAASALMIVAFVPQELSSSFLSVYAATGMVFGIAIMLLLGNATRASMVRYWAPVTLLGALALALAWPTNGIWALYAVALLMSDYLASQSGSHRMPVIYRVTMFVSALPIVFYSSMFTLLIEIRIALCLIVIASVLASVKALRPLRVTSPIAVIGISNLAYYGTLFAMTVILTGHSLRFWYMGTQVAFGLLLKRFDYMIRNDALSHPYIDYGIAVMAIAIPLVLMPFWFKWSVVLAYSAGALAIWQLGRFITR